MASQSVTVLCPNGRRNKVSVTSSKLLHEVLEESCLSQGYDPDTYELKHQHRILDGSLSFRLSGLPNNVTLELVAVPEKTIQEAEIAIQLSDGTRQTKKVLNSTSLSELLVKFSSEFGKNLLTPEGANAVASLSYMNKQWKGSVELANATLKSIGITSGKALLRYNVVVLSDEARIELEEKLAKETERRKKLEEIYSKQKVENEHRARLEAEREKEVEMRHQQFLEEQKREIQRLADEREQLMETDQAQPSRVGELPAQTPQAERTEPSHFPSRLQQLQNVLNTVNTSLDTNAADFLPDRLISEDGRIHLDRASTLEPAVNLNSEMDFSNFKFPEIPISTYGSIIEAEKKSKDLNSINKADRNALIFQKSKPQAVTSNEEISADFFDLTVDDAKVLQRSLREEVRAQSQRALLPKGFIEQKNRELKEQAYKNAVVRFLVNDLVIQAQFYSKEPISRLFEFIRESFVKDTKFELFLTQKISYAENRSLLDEGIAPKSTIVIQFRDQKLDYLTIFDKMKFRECSQEEANSACQEWLEGNTVFRPYNPMVTEEPTPIKRSAEPVSMDYDEPEARRKPPESNVDLPKWLKKK